MDYNQDYTQYQYHYYQNLYNSFYSYRPEIDKRAKEIRRLGLLGGGALIGFTVMQYVIAVLLRIFNLYDLYANNTVFQAGISCIIPVLYIVLPFTILYLIYRPHEKLSVSVFETPKSKKLSLYAIFAGLAVCSVADGVTSVFQTLTDSIGIEFSTVDSLTPDNVMSNILNFIACAIIPPLVEEFAFRGVLMQPLRKYGDKFAIVMSSILFALAHGNMVQIPFAFIAGLSLGYFQIATGSIWTSIIIHCLNNGIATIISIYYTKFPNASWLFYLAIEVAIFLIGIFAMILFIKNREYKLRNDASEFKGSVKVASYLCTPTVVIAIIYALYTSLSLTKITSITGLMSIIAANTALSVIAICGALKIHNDTRIKYTGWYTCSAVIMCLTMLACSFVLLASVFVVR